MKNEFIKLVENTNHNDELINKLNTNLWYHNTDISPQDFKFIDKSNQQKDSIKPNGLWLAKGQDWLHFVKFEMTEDITKYIYQVDFKSNTLLNIDSEETITTVSRYYHGKLYENNYYTSIDWRKIADSYDGIIITDFFKFRRFASKNNHIWYYSFDMDSVCIWNKKAIIDIKIVGEFQ